jgi:hypothetical protein
VQHSGRQHDGSPYAVTVEVDITTEIGGVVMEVCFSVRDLEQSLNLSELTVVVEASGGVDMSV